MSTDKELLKIGEFARLAGTNLRTLRYYEELGLLQPAGRSEGGFRYYRPADLNRVRMIHNLQNLGLHLEEIHELLDTRFHKEGDRKQWIESVRKALTEQRRLIDERAEALREQQEFNAKAAEKLAECETCVHTPNKDNRFCETCQTTGLTLPEYLSGLF